MYRRLRLCSNRGGYEAIAEPAQPIELGEAKLRLEAQGWPVVDARVLLIVRLDIEVTISRAGRLLFKTQDPRRAEQTFERLRSILTLPAMEKSPGAELASG